MRGSAEPAEGSWARLVARDLPPALVEAAVALAAARGVTPQRLAQAVAARLEAGAPVDVEVVLHDLAGARARADRAHLDAAGTDLVQHGARVVLAGLPGYPPRLADAWPELGAPAWLFVQDSAGQPLGGAGPAVAVVGTRHPTLDGLQTARRLGFLLSQAGVLVVSGLARGIDQAAHQGALDAGGATVAVLGTGFGVDYPRGDAALRAAVREAGGLVTELLPGTRPHPANFLARNRIISGLADAVVVVEGRARSGAQQTARLAAGQGRDVWAVPGSLNAPTSRVPLDLIRDGAQVVTRYEDVVEAALDLAAARGEGPGPAGSPSVMSAMAGERALPGLGPAAARLLTLLGATPSPAGALVTAAGLPVPAVMAALAELCEHGLARATPRGFVTDAKR